MNNTGKERRTLRVASVQFESAPGDKDFNFRKIESFVAEAARQKVRLIVFPECCITGYWFMRNLSLNELTRLAEPVFTGPSSQRLIELARRFEMTIGAGLVERNPTGEFYNSYVVALPDGTAHRHRKLHAFEHPAISSGAEYTVFDIPDGFRVGVLICYDCNIVENVRMTALQGAEILIAPHQTGGCRSKNPHLMGVIERRLWDERQTNPSAIESEFRGEKGRGWLMRWLPSRAHDNGMFLIFSNGVGVDDDEIRTGNAMILDPYGRILVETSKAADDMVIADLDASLLLVETSKAADDMVIADLDASLLAESTGRRWMRARRPSLYVPLTKPTGNECDTRKLKFEE
jgi:predicted amidohydrolase